MIMLRTLGLIFAGLIMLGLLGPVLSFSFWGLRSLLKFLLFLVIVKTALRLLNGNDNNPPRSRY